MFAMAIISTLCYLDINFFHTISHVTNIVLAVGPAAVTADYFNNIITPGDLNMRKVGPKLYDRYPMQDAEMIGFLKAFNYERMVDVDSIEHFENNRYWVPFTIASQSAIGGGGYTPGAGVGMKVVLSADSLDDSNRFFSQLNDMITFPGNDTLNGIIIAIAGTGTSTVTLTIVPNQSTDSLPVLAAGATLITMSNTWSEGAGQPNSRYHGATLFTFRSQTIKTTFEASGRQLVTESWVKVTNPITGAEIGWWSEGLATLEKEHNIKKQGMLLTGQPITNTAAVDSTNANATLVGYGGTGMLPYVETYGIPFAFAPQDISLQMYYETEKLRTAQSQGYYMCLFEGIDYSQTRDQALADYNKRTDIAFTRDRIVNKWFGQSEMEKTLEMQIGFGYLTVGQTSYCFKRMNAYSAPQLLGAAGYTASWRATGFSMDGGKDAKTGRDIPAISMVYRGTPGYDRKDQMWSDGAQSPRKIGPNDTYSVYCLSDVGNEFFGGNGMVNYFNNTL